MRKNISSLIVVVILTVLVITVMTTGSDLLADIPGWSVEEQELEIEGSFQSLTTWFSTFEVHEGYVYGKRGDGDDQEFMRSGDGVNFEEFAENLPPADKYRRMVFAKENIVLATETGRVYTTTDGTETWDMTLEVDGAEFLGWSAATDKNENIYLATYGDPELPAIYKSTDGGVTWSTVLELPNTRHFHTIGVDPYTGYVWATTGDVPDPTDVWYSKDGGESWESAFSQPQMSAMEFTEEYVIFGRDWPSADVFLYDKETGELDLAFTAPELLHSIYTIKRMEDGIFFAVILSYDPSIVSWWASKDLETWYMVGSGRDYNTDYNIYMPEFDGFLYHRQDGRVEIK